MKKLIQACWRGISGFFNSILNCFRPRKKPAQQSKSVSERSSATNNSGSRNPTPPRINTPSTRAATAPASTAVIAESLNLAPPSPKVPDKMQLNHQWVIKLREKITESIKELKLGHSSSAINAWNYYLNKIEPEEHPNTLASRIRACKEDFEKLTRSSLHHLSVDQMERLDLVIKDLNIYFNEFSDENYIKFLTAERNKNKVRESLYVAPVQPKPFEELRRERLERLMTERKAASNLIRQRECTAAIYAIDPYNPLFVRDQTKEELLEDQRNTNIAFTKLYMGGTLNSLG